MLVKKFASTQYQYQVQVQQQYQINFFNLIRVVLLGFQLKCLQWYSFLFICIFMLRVWLATWLWLLCVFHGYFCSEHFNEEWDINICMMLSKWIDILFQFIVFQNNTLSGWWMHALISEIWGALQKEDEYESFDKIELWWCSCLVCTI